MPYEIIKRPETLIEAKIQGYKEGYSQGYKDGEEHRKILASKTNIGRIQTMDVKELATFLENDAFEKPWCDASEDEVDPVTKECKRWDCVKCTERWLKQEVEQ